MSRGQIISGGSGGLYQVEIQYNRARGEAIIARLQAEIVTIDARLVELVVEIADAEIAADYAHDVLQSKIAAFNSVQQGADLAAEQAELAALITAANADEIVTPAEQRAIDRQQAVVDAIQKGYDLAKKDVEVATVAERSAAALVPALKTEERTANLRKLSANKQIVFLQDNLAADQTVAAWCADYNENLTGQVGMIETGLVEGPQHVIRPGGGAGDLAGYDAASDGQLASILNMTPASTFLNYALLPGQAKWQPRYRFGRVDQVDLEAGTVDVTLDPARSTHQHLDINQAAKLFAVPVFYMSCHAAAFARGDHVVVEFAQQDWGQPMVIGFVSDPKLCSVRGLGHSLTGRLFWDAVASKWNTGATPGFGNIDWRGPDGDVLSWRGVPGRYFDWAGWVEDQVISPAVHDGVGVFDVNIYTLVVGQVFFTYGVTGNYLITKVLQQLPGGVSMADVIDAGTWGDYFEFVSYWDSNIWSQGEVLITAPGDRVAGAARKLAEDGLVFVKSNQIDGITSEQVYIGNYDGTGAAQVLNIDYPNQYGSIGLSPWFFNESATEAVAVRYFATPAVHYYRCKLTIDWATRTASFQQLEASSSGEIGESGSYTSSEGSTTCPGPPEFELTSSHAKSMTGGRYANGSFKFYDYQGDVQVEGEIVLDFNSSIAFDSSSSTDCDYYHIFAESGTQSYLGTGAIKFGGVALWSGDLLSGSATNSKSGSGTPAVLDTNHTNSKTANLERRVLIDAADLRLGILILDVQELTIDPWSVSVDNLHAITNPWEAQPFSVNYVRNWEKRITTPGGTTVFSGSEGDKTLTSLIDDLGGAGLMYILGATDWDPSADFNEAYPQVSGGLQFVGRRIDPPDNVHSVSRLDSTGMGIGGIGVGCSIIGKANAYPGDLTKTFISTLKSPWRVKTPQTSYNALTGGDPETLIPGEIQPRMFTPIGPV